jgi:hypothetical protein
VSKEAERLAVLRGEIGRVLELLTSRPPKEQDEEQIKKLLDLQATIEGVQREMQPTISTKAQQANSSKPKHHHEVNVSVDFTSNGTAFCVVQADSADVAKGSQRVPEILPPEDSRAEPTPVREKRIRALLRRNRKQPLGCFGRLLSCAREPAADDARRSGPEAVSTGASEPLRCPPPVAAARVEAEATEFRHPSTDGC